MGRQYNMPITAGEGGSNFSAFKAPELYQPLPEKEDDKVYNEIFVPLCNPSRWAIFNPTPQAIQNLGYVNSPNPIAMPQEINTFYFKFPLHKVNNFYRPDGTVGFSYVICPDALNEYMRMHFGAMFDRPKCAFCEQSQIWWQEWNLRWTQLGYSDEARKKLPKDKYINISENDSVLKDTRSLAKKYATQERYLINIFDHSKFSGKRPLDENQTAIGYQIWLAPKTVFNKLENIFNMAKESVDAGLDTHFFDTESPNGSHILTLIKDTLECRDGNLLNTKYDVIAGKRFKYPDQWLAYLDNLDVMVDPSRFLFLTSYSDAKAYVGEENAKSSKTRPQNVPATQSAPNVPSGFVPVAPVTHVTSQVVPVTPQVAPYMPNVVPQVAPVPPVMPVAPQVAPYVPIAPQVVVPMPQAVSQVSMAPQVPPVPTQAPVPQRVQTIPTVPVVHGDAAMPPSFKVPESPVQNISPEGEVPPGARFKW